MGKKASEFLKCYDQVLPDVKTCYRISNNFQKKKNPVAVLSI